MVSNEYDKLHYPFGNLQGIMQFVLSNKERSGMLTLSVSGLQHEQFGILPHVLDLFDIEGKVNDLLVRLPWAACQRR